MASPYSKNSPAARQRARLISDMRRCPHLAQLRDAKDATGFFRDL